MPEVKVTQALSSAVKQYRKEIKMRGDTLSRQLNKNTSFISQLETGKMDAINTNTLYDIFDILIREENKESNEVIDKHEKITSILDTLQLTLSDKELRKQEWIRTMDLQYRMIPIPETLINLIKDKLDSYGISSYLLIERINANASLYAVYSLEDIEKFEDNKVYYELKFIDDKLSEHMYVKFNLDRTLIDDIVSKKVVRCNYVTMKIIIMHLLMLDGISENTSYHEAEKILLANKFYTMLDKQNIESNNNYSQLAPHDIKFREVLKDIDDEFISINDRQPDLLNRILPALLQNIQDNPSLTLSVISKDLTELNELSSDNKRAFIEDYKELIYRYKTNSINNTPKIETF